MIMQQIIRGNNGSYNFLDEYDIPMLKYVVFTCRLHICDMFDEMPIMASRGPVKGLFKYLLLQHCLCVILLI